LPESETDSVFDVAIPDTVPLAWNVPSFPMVPLIATDEVLVAVKIPFVHWVYITSSPVTALPWIKSDVETIG